MASRKCARPGCRAWAVRQTDYCYAHRHLAPGSQQDTAAADSAAGRAERSAMFARAARAGQVEQLIEQAVQQVITQTAADRSLETEIGALRIVLRRVLALDALDGDPQATAATVSRLVDSIVRAVKTQRQLTGGVADAVADALTTMLIELGIGDE